MQRRRQAGITPRPHHLQAVLEGRTGQHIQAGQQPGKRAGPGPSAERRAPTEPGPAPLPNDVPHRGVAAEQAGRREQRRARHLPGGRRTFCGCSLPPRLRRGVPGTEHWGWRKGRRAAGAAQEPARGSAQPAPRLPPRLPLACVCMDAPRPRPSPSTTQAPIGLHLHGHAQDTPLQTPVGRGRAGFAQAPPRPPLHLLLADAGRAAPAGSLRPARERERNARPRTTEQLPCDSVAPRNSCLGDLHDTVKNNREKGTHQEPQRGSLLWELVLPVLGNLQSRKEVNLNLFLITQVLGLKSLQDYRKTENTSGTQTV